ncbi:MAG: hypothetical protein IKZ82_13325 [Clostridia bacterium]|nr:hypothetical protein [Clostridia bacterium]
MKRSFKSVLAVALALALGALCLPISAIRAETLSDFTVPDGYNEHDYTAVASFLETEDESGVKNGEKIGNGYDVLDPATWESNPYITRFEWVEVEGELRIKRINVGWNYLYGALDVSSCTALEALIVSECGLSGLDISGCSALKELQIGGNYITEIELSSCPLLEQLWCDNMPLTSLDLSACPNITFVTCNYTDVASINLSGCASLTDLSCENAPLAELDISDCAALYNLWAPNCELTSLVASNCPEMRFLSCQNNSIETLSVSGCEKLELLDCSGNAITEIDVSSSPLLREFYCVGNMITEFDLSNNPLLKLDSVAAVGEGFVGYYYNANYDFGYAQAAAEGDCRFVGWFDAEDNEISTNAQLNLKSLAYTDVFAVFESPFLIGDADDNGEITVLDAVLIMRYAMNIIDDAELDLENSNVDGDGNVTVYDALAVFRMAMGI